MSIVKAKLIIRMTKKFVHLCYCITENAGFEKKKKKSAAPAIPRRSPIQVLSWPDVA